MVTATDIDTPPGDLIYSFDCDNNGSYEKVNPPGDNAANCEFDDAGTYTVGVRVSDGSESDEATVQVVVGNASPVVSLTGPAPATDEGETVTYQFTASDAGGDTLTFTVDCGAGVQVGGITFENGSGSFQCRFPDGPVDTTVSITADDGEDSTDDSAPISISNIPPDYTAPNNQTAQRGQARDISLGTFTDPGTDGPWEITVDWGDGNSETFTVPESARLPGGGFDLGDRSHTFADSGGYTVSVTVAEAGGQPSDTGAFTVAAENAAPPVVDLNGAGAGVDQGATVTFTEGGGPVRMDLLKDLTVSDPDGQVLTQATARIVNAPDGTAERLAADTTGTGIVASYDPKTGVLTLTGPATLAQFQQVLRKVTYKNTSQNPTAGDRSIELVVNDGVLDSAPATATVTVAPLKAMKADLDVRIDTPRTVTEGKPFPITFKAVNKGPDTAKNVVVKTVLPRDVKLVFAPDKCRYDRDTRTLACKLGNLAEGAKTALRIRIKARDADDLKLRATVDSDTSDPEAQNNREAEAIEVKAALKPEPKPESSGCRESGKGRTFSGTSGPDVMRGTPGDDTFFGFGGNDKIYGLGGEDSIIAGDGSDTIHGGDCSDSMDANDGNDFVYGEDGKDSLNGGDGNDRIHGGSGVDSFNGAGGTDHLYAKDGEKESVNGGSERDHCVADRKDTIINCP